MPGMNRLDRLAEPSALLGVETRDGGGEVSFVNLSTVLRLEEEHDLRTHERDPLVIHAAQPRQGSTDGRITPEQPFPSNRFVHQELESPWIGAAPPAPHSMEVRVDSSGGQGLQGAVVRESQVPSHEVSTDDRLLRAQDRDVEILVIPCLPAQPEIDRPAARDPPSRGQPGEQTSSI